MASLKEWYNVKNIFKSAVKQMGSLLCIHLITLLPGLIVTVLLLPVTTKFKAIELVVSAFCVIIYFSIMFVSGWRFGNHDIKHSAGVKSCHTASVYGIFIKPPNLINFL